LFGLALFRRKWIAIKYHLITKMFCIGVRYKYHLKYLQFFVHFLMFWKKLIKTFLFFPGHRRRCFLKTKPPLEPPGAKSIKLLFLHHFHPRLILECSIGSLPKRGEIDRCSTRVYSGLSPKYYLARDKHSTLYGSSSLMLAHVS
jgi:hypothetical protein